MSAEDQPEDELKSRWGDALSEGFVRIPRVLFTRQRDLHLDAGEVLVLANLLSSWWRTSDHPYPAVSTLAHRMNVSLRTVQRYVESLERKGFVERLRDETGNGRASELRVTRYALAGTVQKLAAVAKTAPAPQAAKRKTPSNFNAGRRRAADPSAPAHAPDIKQVEAPTRSAETPAE